MNTKITWDDLADAGGQQVAKRLSGAGVADTLAGRVHRGRRQRGAMHAGASVLALGALSLGAWAVVPVWTNESNTPASASFDVHVDPDVTFLGPVGGSDLGPTFVECGSAWSPPVSPGVTVPSTDSTVPVLSTVVHRRYGANESEVLFSGDSIGVDDFPAVVSYVHWPEPTQAPTPWDITTAAVLVDSAGTVVAVGYEPPQDWIVPVGREPIAGEVSSHVDMHINLCHAMLSSPDTEVRGVTGSAYLEGEFTLHVITQVFHNLADDQREVLATFADYGVSEPFTLIVDPADAIARENHRQQRVVAAQSYLARLIELQGTVLSDVSAGVRPVAGVCERIQTASEGLSNVAVLAHQPPRLDAEFLVDSEGLWLSFEGSDISMRWWSGHPMLVMLLDGSGAVVATMVTDGSSVMPDGRNVHLSQLLVSDECMASDIVPGTYDVVVVTSALFGNATRHVGYNDGYETWIRIGPWELPEF